LLDGALHEFEVNAQIVMDQHVLKTSQPLPVHLRIRVFDRLAQSLT
jgi:hypothetical protein